MTLTVKEKFTEWACSLSGCDGGNPKADIWLSGIEWGYDSRESSIDTYYKELLPQEILKGEYTPKTNYIWKDHLNYTFGRNVAKLFTAINAGNVEDYRTLENRNEQELFRLNLYPIAFNSTDDDLWRSNRLNEWTGFEEKALYKTWCFMHRFPAIAKKVREYNPKCIICTGTSYLTDFFVCFAGYGSKTSEIKVENISGTRKLYSAKLNDKTVLVVIPFFSGAYGLNSNELLQKTGGIISRLIP